MTARWETPHERAADAHRRHKARACSSTNCGCRPSKSLWPRFAEPADKEGWPAARFLAALAEHELAERDRRRIERHLAEGKLPARKDAGKLRLRSRADDLEGAGHGAGRGRRLARQRRQSCCCSGRPAAARVIWRPRIGLALIENGYRVLFTRTTDLVQKLQIARRDLGLESAINRLDRFDLLILDDLAYVTKDQAETSVLFELIGARYERRSMLITANQPFGEWGKVFPDPAMTLAAVDRLVHHAIIFELNVESYRRRQAIERKKGPGRPTNHATPANLAAADLSD